MVCRLCLSRAPHLRTDKSLAYLGEAVVLIMLSAKVKECPVVPPS
jgi:hypothetical protein